ncbi:MAG: GPR endopeptidase [Limnochordia bacterium]
MPSFVELKGLRLSRLRPESLEPGSLEQDGFFAEHGVRTDLAFEAHQVVRQAGVEQVPGVSTETEEHGFGTITRIHVEDEAGAAVIGKAKGRYITIQAPGLRRKDRAQERQVSEALAKELESLLRAWGIGPEQLVLVVGLGNWNATPDNVGPLTVSKLLVTRHLYEYRALEEEVLGRMRPVAALSPGVLGLTGIETAEIVHAVVEKVRPAAVLCVDALASMSVERLGTTLQLSDAGIRPGSGVGNTRRSLSYETLGVPVFALGVPTVIYATTIVSEAVDALWERVTQPAAAFGPPGPAPGSGALLDPSRIVVTAKDPAPAASAPAAAPGTASLPRLDPHSRRQLIQEVLGPSMGSLVVTPKEIDVLVDTLSDVLADGLNEALHPGISAAEAAAIR